MILGHYDIFSIQYTYCMFTVHCSVHMYSKWQDIFWSSIGVKMIFVPTVYSTEGTFATRFVLMFPCIIEYILI